MRAKRTDANHAEIRTEFRRLLGDDRVFDSSAFGHGFPDLVVQYAGLTMLVEVKTKTGKLTKAQKESGLMMRLVRTVQEAQETVAVLKHWHKMICGGVVGGLVDYPENRFDA